MAVLRKLMALLTSRGSLFVFAHSLGLALVGPCAEARDDLVPGSRYTSARSSGMGDTCIGLTEDIANALFCNPAGLPKLRGLRAEPVNVTLHSSLGTLTTIGAGTAQIINLDQFKSTLTSNSGTQVGVGGSILPALSWRFIGFGVLFQSSLGAIATGSNIRYHTNYELTPAVNLAYRFASGIVKVGYSLQWINKTQGTVTAASSGTLAWNDGLYQGGGLAHTAAGSLTLPITYLPQLNFVARNIMGTTYSLSSILPLAANSAGTPPADPMTFDVSFGVNPKFGTGYFANVILVFKDILGTSAQSILGRLGAGLELVVAGKFAFRGGYIGGYPSAGLGYRHRGGEFNVSYYSEELGSSYMQSADARVLLQYQIYGSTSGPRR